MLKTERNDPVLRDATTPLSALRVLVQSGRDAGLSVVVDQPRVLIGRGETADVRLQDATVSLCHVELMPTDQGILVCDLGSLNRVRLGSVIVERCIVPPGSLLTLGSTVIRVDAAGERPGEPEALRSFGGLLGESPPMRALYALLDRLARTDLSLVIQGPTGTGKELAPRAVHAAGHRSGKPFVVLDCTAIPSSLATSVLFGSEKGAYTGAVERRMGVFEAAHGGVLFMDEVGELPLELQPLLLRVLQQREVVSVGSTRARPIDVRVMCATWRDLRAMVNRGTFREDLYYRLAQATVWMPSLAERREDIRLLANTMLSRIPQHLRAARTLSEEAMDLLTMREYPGNVRELHSVVERLALLADGPMITGDNVTFERMIASERTRGSSSGMASEEATTESQDEVSPFKEARRTLIDEFEKDYLTRLMERTASNLTRAATLAGLERGNLRELLKKHGLRGQPIR